MTLGWRMIYGARHVDPTAEACCRARWYSAMHQPHVGLLVPAG
jgi:hypothetical protein